MTLDYLISAKDILLDIGAKEVEGVIDELVEFLGEKEGFCEDSRSQLKASFIERERSFSTGIGKGVAIPHVLSDKVQEPVVVLGRSPDGVGFGSLDEDPVKVVVLFVSPKGESQQHLHVLAAIGKSFRDPSKVDRIMAGDSAETVFAALRNKS